jgi:phospholipid-binding lipoprotein MlaA
MTVKCCALLLTVALFGGCATQTAAKPDARDPFERMNRATFKFNEAVDRAVAKPVAKGYRAVAPQFVETGVSNFMDNLAYPIVLVNDVLQGKFKAALNDTGRLMLNTTLGLGGILDPASDVGLAKNDEDFGQTFGRWGAAPGPYVVLPFFGPSTVRDTVGRVGDYFANPRHYIESDSIRYSLLALDIVDTRARLLSVEDALNQAYDRYAFLRNAYLQRRAYLVSDGEIEEEPLDEQEMLEESE